jgi:hypothetical protein
MSLKGTLRAIKQWFGGGEAPEPVPERRKEPEVPPPEMGASNEQQRIKEKPRKPPSTITPSPPGEVTVSAAPSEGRTQFNERSAQGPRQEIVIGLDFGTAFTKVVLGEIRAHYAVPFGPYATRDNPYLLPSGITLVGERGECVLGERVGSGEWCGDLKMPIITRTMTQDAKVKAAAFLALVFRWVRDWFLTTHEGTYRGKRLVWLVNVGLPTDSYDDKELTELYQQLAGAAWTASVMPGPVSLGRVRDYLETIVIRHDRLPLAIRDRLLAPDMFGCFPEFAVQLSGYVRSPRRQPDLHALVDIGAGTVDVTTFNVHRNADDDDLYPVMDQKVIAAGVNFLVGRRIESCGKPGGWRPSPFENIPDDRTFARKLRTSQQALRAADREVLGQVGDTLRAVLKHTKDYRYPLSRHWDTGVPTFLVGGGALVQAYRDRIQRFESLRPPFLIRTMDLDIPEDLIAPNAPKSSYDRLSVAYGLSFSPDDIGEIRLKSQTGDDQAAAGAARDVRDRFVGKELI